MAKEQQALKLTEFTQQNKKQLETLWLENRYRIQSGVEYVHFLFFIYGKFFMTIVLAAVYILISMFLAKLLPGILVPGSYKMLFSQFLVLFAYFFRVVPFALKKKYHRLSKEEFEKFEKNEKHMLKQVVVLKDQVQGCVQLKTLEQYSDLEIKKQIEGCIRKLVNHLKDADVYVIDSVCIKNCQQQEEFAGILKGMVDSCEEHLKFQVDKKSEDKKDKKKRFLVAPTFSMSVFDVKYLMEAHKFEIKCSHFIGGMDALFGVSQLVLIKEI